MNKLRELQLKGTYCRVRQRRNAEVVNARRRVNVLFNLAS